ncbi:hypothetical protein HUU05_03135 [candidate division KSB1 bacterium]|nr:hypothetical protein [candidate division KSB1 bacterium]
MNSNSLWKIENGKLTIGKNEERFKALEFLFEIVLDSGQNEIQITDASEQLDKENTLITGSSATWGAADARIKLTYDTATGKLTRIELTKNTQGFGWIELPGAPLSQLTFGLIATVPNNGESEICTLAHYVSGHVRLKSFDLPFRIDNPAPGQSYFFDLALEKAENKPGLNDFAAFISPSDTPRNDLKTLPQELFSKTESSIELGGLRMRIDPNGDTKLVSIAVSLNFLKEVMWTVVPDLLAVGGLWVELEVDYPLEPAYRFPMFKVGGLVQIGDPTTNDGRVALTARWPDLAIHGELEQGSSIKLGQILQHFGLVPKGMRDMAIDRLWFLAEPTTDPKTFAFYIDIKEVWQVELPGKQPLALTDLSLNLNYTGAAQSGAPSRLSSRFEGKLNIAGIDLDLLADYDTHAGWQFQGNAAAENPIPIGTLIDELKAKFNADGTLPAPLAGLMLMNLQVAFNTLSKDFFFGGEMDFPLERDNNGKPKLDGKKLALLTSIALQSRNGFYQKQVSGKLELGALEFDVIFDQTPTASRFLAAYQDRSGSANNIGDLIKAVSSEQSVIALAQPLQIELKDALFIYDSSGPSSRFLFCLDIGGGIDLSGLPLVGKLFSSSQNLGLSFQPLFANQAFTLEELRGLQTLVPTGGATLPDKAITAGMGLAITLCLGDSAIALALPIQLDQTTSTTQIVANTNGQMSAPVTPGASVANDGVTWLDLQKSFGPVQFQRLGVQLQNDTLAFLLDASLSAGGLTLTLDGLGVSVALKDLAVKNFKPAFSLRGLGLDYSNSAVEIGGSFLRMQYQDEHGQPCEEYDGMAIIRAESFTLSAIGSYANNGQPSLFVYAVLDYPLGGPAFFFVTGLAAGFGYNRFLKMPTIDQVAQFPLITQVTGNNAPLPNDAQGRRARLQQELAGLHEWLPPKQDKHFLAVGIRFTSFELVDSFVLLDASFGDRFEIDVLGFSTLIAPTPEKAVSSMQPVTPLAEVQMALKASFIPEEGFLGVQAQLTSNSYVLSRACHLAGGFAFFAWYSGVHSGDFVLSLGGYHPKFVVPAHYPLVPRLGFNWQVSDKLFLKGDAYFALTAHAFMAGGHLQAVWQSGHIKAWFMAGADFLISWKPYFYDAEIYVDMGAAILLGSLHITIDVGADLHLWGPDFSGKAKIHLHIVSFTVSFGKAAPKPKPISWATFSESFLPAQAAAGKAAHVCGVAIAAGLLRTIKTENGDERWIVHPQKLRLITNSLIPATRAKIAGDTTFDDRDYVVTVSSFGVGPMALKASDLANACHSITVQREGSPANDDFAYQPVLKKIPAALWGETLQPNLNGGKFIDNALSGFELTPAKPPLAAATHAIARNKLQYDTTPVESAFYFESAARFTVAQGNGKSLIDQTILAQQTCSTRDSILAALGFNTSEALVQVGPNLGDSFIKAPQVGDWVAV